MEAQATYPTRRVPLRLTLTRQEQFTLWLRADELHEMVGDPMLDVDAMFALRRDFMRVARTLARHGVNYWGDGD